MYKKRIGYTFLYILILSIFMIPIINQHTISNNLEKPNNMKVSASWDLSGSPIVIDNNNPSSNWLTTVSTYGWCSGSGTEQDPFLIQNVYMDIGGTGSGIIIQNSDGVFFKIYNCTITNSGSTSTDAGIKLDASHYGLIVKSNISNNQGQGIYCLNCDNTTIRDNVVTDNAYHGIFLDDSCRYGQVLNNTVFNNVNSGILVYDCIDHIVSNNTASYNVQSGIRLTRTTGSMVSNNILIDNYYGISLFTYSDDNEIKGNIINNSDYHGIILNDYCHRNNVYDNLIKENQIDGIRVEQYCDNNTFYQNTISENTQIGFTVQTFGCDNNEIVYNFLINNVVQNALDLGINTQWNNTEIGNYWSDYGGVDADDDGIGDTPYDVPNAGGSQDYFPIYENPLFEGNPIHIDDTGVKAHNWSRTALLKTWVTGTGTLDDPYTIRDLVMDNSYSGTCIKIENSDVYFQIVNCTLLNGGTTGFGAEITLNNTNNGIIRNNTCQGGRFSIFISQNSDHNNITENNIINANYRGICIYVYSDYNMVANNTIIESGVGVLITGSCHNNLVQHNYADGNNLAGIYLNNNCSQNHIINNDIVNSTSCDNGIVMVNNCTDNEIYQNYVANNWRGIYIYDGCDDNTFWDNNIIDCRDYGIWIRNLTSPSSGNIIYENYLDTRGHNGYDECLGNYWYFGTTGNSWANYSGVDANDDGIGDSPYNIPGDGNRQDLYPIWEDGDDLAPIITINLPVDNQEYASDVPTYSITVIDPNLDSIWYSLDDGATIYPISLLTGTIDYDLWKSLANGNFTLTFYANDTLGHVGSTEVYVIKYIAPTPGPFISFGFFFILFGLVTVIIILGSYKKRYNFK